MLVIVLICMFVACDIILMLLCFFGIVDPFTFYILINSFTGCIIIGLNVNQAAVYCKLNGQPYKSEKHYQEFKLVFYISMLWSLAFGIKLSAIFYGVNLLTIDEQYIDIATACSLAFTDFLTIIVPFFTVVDTSFVQAI